MHALKTMFWLLLPSSVTTHTQMPNCNVLIWKYKITYLGHSIYRGNYSFSCQNAGMCEHSSNQFTTPSTRHLHNGITRHITATSIAPRRLNNFNSEDFKHYPFLFFLFILFIYFLFFLYIFVVPRIVILGWINPMRCNSMQIFIYC